MQHALEHVGCIARDRLTHWTVAGAILAAAHARSERLGEAQRAMAELLRAAPQLRLSSAPDWMPRLRWSDDIGRHAAANHLAGMPE